MRGGESKKRRRWDCEDGEQEDSDEEKQEEPTADDKLRGFSIPKIAKGEKKENPGSFTPEKIVMTKGETRTNYHSANKNRPHLRWSNKYDKPLPQQLLDKCREAECQICGVKFTGPTTCEQHYEGAKHGKKVVVELEEIYTDKPDEPRPKKFKCDLTPSIRCQTEMFLADLADSLEVPLTPRQLEQREMWEPPLPLGILANIKEQNCNVCNLTFSSESMATSHYSGRPHEKKVTKVVETLGLAELPRKKIPGVQCDSVSSCSLCKVGFNGPSCATMHYAGAKHKKKLAEANKKGLYCGDEEDEEEDRSFGIGAAFGQRSGVGKEPKKKVKSNVKAANEASPFYCPHCELDCQTEAPYKMHMLGKNHLRKLKMNKEGPSTDGRKCNVCNITCGDENSLEMHRNGKPHAKMLLKVGEVEVGSGDNWEGK